MKVRKELKLYEVLEGTSMGKKKDTSDKTIGVRAFSNKIDSWLDNIDKKLQREAILNRALTNNHLEHQKELNETLRLFEESLKYHKENYEY